MKKKLSEDCSLLFYWAQMKTKQKILVHQINLANFFLNRIIKRIYNVFLMVHLTISIILYLPLQR